jgi:hypothetical protein
MIDMRKSARARIGVSVARNFSNQFTNEQIFSLKGIDPDPSIDRVECNFRFPSPVFGQWFNIKIRLLHDANSAHTEMFGIGFIGKELHKFPVSQQQMPQEHEFRGSR